jgi:intracellular multiplication protein IcmD
MSDTPDTTGEIASKVTTSDANLTEVITAGSEAAGVAEEAASIEKFKLHKDNPTQIPIGRKK